MEAWPLAVAQDSQAVLTRQGRAWPTLAVVVMMVVTDQTSYPP